MLAAAVPAVPSAASAPLLFGLTAEQRAALARQVYDQHLKGKRRRRAHDLQAEKLLIHIDGSNDGQWTDILNGSAVRIPPRVGGSLRKQENLLQPLVTNMVAYHTGIPYRAMALPPADRVGRQRARIATLLANDLIRRNNLNMLVAAALGVGAAYGHGLIHAYFREEAGYVEDNERPVGEEESPEQGPDPTALLGEPDASVAAQMPAEAGATAGPTGFYPQPRRGRIDLWLGDPWATVYDEGATRFAVHWMSYERTLPVELVREAFDDVPEAATITGRDDLPSASRFQKALRSWDRLGGGATHGSRAVQGGSGGGEIVALICKETAPGMDRAWPRGRQTCIAVSGRASTDAQFGGGGGGTPILLWDGPLPGGCLSGERFYPCGPETGDDVLGKPWVQDLDDVQIDLNQLLTRRAERIRKFSFPPLIAQANMLEQDVSLDYDQVVEFAGGAPPYYLEPPQGLNNELTDALADCRESMFRMGGWQAASRGEGKAGDAAAKTVALARADDSVFTTANADIQAAVCRLIQRCHALVKEHLTAPWLVETTGRDVGYLATPFIHAEELADTPPAFVLTQGSATPDAQLQMMLNIVSEVGGDQQPLMATSLFHERCPYPELVPEESEAERMRRIRPLAVNEAIRTACEAYAQPGTLRPQDTEAVAQQVHAALLQQFKILWTDDAAEHVLALDEIVHDVEADALTDRVAELRQQEYLRWQQQQALAAAPQQQPQPQGSPSAGGSAATPNVQFGQDPQYGGSPTADLFASAGGEVRSLTAQATAGAA
jgi:hypothetical protein